MAAWDRQPKEPPKAYQYFTLYRDLGPQERSLEKVGKLGGVSAARIEVLSDQYGWVARCDQWDAHVRSLHDRAFLSEVAKRGKQRGAAYTALLGKCLEALKGVKTENARLSEIAQAMKVATEGMRLEEGLETARVTMEVQDARIIISRLPPEVRVPLLRALGDELARRRSGDAPGGIPAGVGAGDEGE